MKWLAEQDRVLLTQEQFCEQSKSVCGAGDLAVVSSESQPLTAGPVCTGSVHGAGAPGRVRGAHGPLPDGGSERRSWQHDARLWTLVFLLVGLPYTASGPSFLLPPWVRAG